MYTGLLRWNADMKFEPDLATGYESPNDTTYVFSGWWSWEAPIASTGSPPTRNLMDAVPVPDPALQRAKLAAAVADPQFRGREGETGRCVF